MNKWISVAVTIYTTKMEMSDCIFCYDDDEAGVHLMQRLSYAEGMKALREAEKLLNRSAELDINRYNPTISYKSLHGYIGRN